VRPFALHDWTLDCYMVNLVIVLSLLPFIFEGYLGTSSDSVYGSEGWETDC
jgi:hypothetical protein